MGRKFRLLNADEIECRVSTVTAKGVSLLLYKDARADMTILDETVGAMNWQRRHTRDNANCIVSLYDDIHGQWIEKEDTGTESNTEKEKGLASDSFKRACTNWGIGRELYTAPFIWVDAAAVEWTEKNGKQIPRTRFKVAEIGYDEKCRINRLKIVTDKGKTAYQLGAASRPLPEQNEQAEPKISAATAKYIEQLIADTNTSRLSMLKHYGVTSVNDLSRTQANECVERLKARKNETDNV